MKMRNLFYSLILCTLILVTASVAEDSPYLVGEFKVTRVVDGDTIAVDGLKDTIRFLCIDTEESEKGSGAEQKIKAIADDYLNYVKEQTRRDPLAKFNTPMGWEAKKFAEQWFPIGSTVRVEYDSLKRKTGFYGRTLGYVLAKRNGKWVNYNVECVRAGMSPYFNKYGASERFEAEFIAAEREARINQRGIWSPYAMGYPDYDSRLVWWDSRAAALIDFENQYGKQDNAFNLADEDDWDRLKEYLGKEIIVLSTIGDVIHTSNPPMLELQHKQYLRVAIPITDPQVFSAVNKTIETSPSDIFYFKGTLEKGFEQGKRDYVYSLPVKSSAQIYPAGLKGKQSDAVAAAPAVEIKLKEGEISWRDAPQQMGQDVVTVGKIIRTKDIGSMTFLNFDPNFKQTLTVVIKKSDYAKFPEPPVSLYKDRTIRIRGKVIEYQGKPEIVVTDTGQIEIVE